ncbi:hypothetical protein BS50DRAFT_574161 [Corynespora cassiicola Philippines]|uniref:Ubiquitin 3 binding protein But2 C-terminal domain-containing protein n=1 Tax=Corynespora cassiicola Philippines TaxID=1448308 RepID=A0A2T2NPV4_CORCC|nr:hypothetical protein BS50DRAFT_574161 [Corynespora cassiicola Philippines]
MKSTVATAILALASTISAAPVPFGTPELQTFYYPATTNVYNQSNGAVDFDSEFGKVERKNGAPELSTMSNFYFYEQSTGKTCKFMFELDGTDYTVEQFGAQVPEFDVFQTTKAVMDDIPGVAGGAPNNKRGQQLGRMRVVPGGQAEVVWGSFEFPCPEANKDVPYAWEVVAVGEAAKMKWSKTDGPWIAYY